MRKDVNTISDLGMGPPVNGNRPLFTTSGWRNDLVLAEGLDPRALGAKADGLNDDSAVFQAAINQAGVGGVIRPYGTYLLASAGLTPLSGQNFDLRYCEFVWPNDTTMLGMIDIDSVQDVTILGGVFDANVANQSAWIEHRHCIRVRDASNVTIQHVTFKGMIGDGIYISHAPSPAVAPFTGSRNIKILNNDFIGANANRNGISVVCGRNMLIQGNYFYQIGKTAFSPGSIDIEPNTGDDFVYDLKIIGNTVDNIGGTGVPNGGIAGGNHVTTAIIDGVVIKDNDIAGPMVWGIRLRCNGAVTEKGMLVEGNYVHGILPGTGVNYGIRVDDATCRIVNNEIDGVQGCGIAQVTSKVFAANNIVRNVSSSADAPGNGFGMTILQTTDVATWIGNVVENCEYGLYIRSSNNVYTGNRLRDNTITNIHVASGTGNRFADNVISGVGTPYAGMGPQVVQIDPSVSADNGNAGKTLTVLVSEPTQLWATTITVDRAVILSTVNAFKGASFRILRPATGAGNLLVGTGPLKSLPASSWCEVMYSGSAWILAAYGAL